MQLTPRYDGPELLRWEVAVDDPATPLVRQRQRLAALLADLDEAQWATPSRCEGWTVRDVVAHLADTNQFWAASVASGRAGTPTRVLAAFDPVATPAFLVDAGRQQSNAETLDRFVDTSAALGDALAGLDADGWHQPAEAPPGHVPLAAVVAHALWDSWVHERDIALPLGLDPVVEPDEVALCLHYAAALSPMFAASRGSTQAGHLVVEASDPELLVVVEVGPTVVVRAEPAPPDAARIAGPAVDLVEALSLRRPLDAEVDPAHRWMLVGLAEVFDVA